MKKLFSIFLLISLCFVLSASNLSSSGISGGGTATVPGGTSGMVQFNSTGAFGGDSNLFWDDTGKQLGVGVTPAFKLDVSQKIGLNGLQVVYLPDQTNFGGTLILGNGGGALSHVTGNDGKYNTFVGLSSGASNTTGNINTALGNSSMFNNLTGIENVAIGVSSLQNNLSGNQNVAIGYSALFSNTSAFANIGIGWSALSNATTGGWNTAVGNTAGQFHQTGNYNTYIGYESSGGTGALKTGQDNNTYVGAWSGYKSDSNSDNNTILGYKAGYELLTGSNNILIGYQAGDAITTGGNNIIIGYDVDAPLATGNNQLNIGNSIYGDLSTGNISVGASSPKGRFDITSQATNDDPNYYVQQNRIVTTDATQTTLHLVTLSDNNIYLIEARIVSRCTGGLGGNAGNGASYILKQSFKRFGGGATAIGVIISDSWEDAAVVGWDATLDVNVNDVRVRVTGAASDDATWHVTVIIQNLSS